MGECFGLFFLIATSLIGIFALIGQLLSRWLKDQDVFGDRVVLTMCGHVENAEFLMRRCIWLGFDEICVVDAGMDEETAAIVTCFKKRHSRITVQTG